MFILIISICATWWSCYKNSCLCYFEILSSWLVTSVLPFDAELRKPVRRQIRVLLNCEVSSRVSMTTKHAEPLSDW